MIPFAGILATIGTLSLTVTRVVDLIRNLVDKQGKYVGSPIWNVAALVIGLVFALGWQLNVSPGLAALVPALAGKDSLLTGVAGQVLTGLLIGAAAGFWHEVLSALSSVQAKNEAVAVSVAPEVVAVNTKT